MIGYWEPDTADVTLKPEHRPCPHAHPQPDVESEDVNDLTHFGYWLVNSTRWLVFMFDCGWTGVFFTDFGWSLLSHGVAE